MVATPDPRLFAALGDPLRLALVGRLGREGALPTTELARETGVTRQAVRKHLDVLARVGLVSDERRGRQRLWTLDPRPLGEVADWAAAYQAQWEARFDRLQHMLDEEDG